MDQFQLHYCLRNMQSVLRNYPAQQELSQEIAQLLEQITSKRYRVAVIGEFKHGKSSLVNALLGIEALPTDSLPTTAVINRVVHDVQQKIVIYYKDGRVEESTLDKLRDYATKTDKEREQRALTIRQIDVHYPSVFGQNGVELLDTPGLNEHETMTETTLSVLDHIDTAIVVLHAMMPLSLSEQELICNLIEQRNIFHLTFVVSFIDRISDEPEEQDRTIGFITERLKKETLELFRKAHDDPELLKKAEYILKEPKVFGLSAKMAMQGFIKNNSEMVRQSRFPHFKLELTAWLTAAQEKDMQSRAEQIARDVYFGFDEWNEAYERQLQAQLDEMGAGDKETDRFLCDGKKELIASMKVMEQALGKCGLSYDPQAVSHAKLIQTCRNIAFRDNSVCPVSKKQAQMWDAIKAFKSEVSACLEKQINDILDAQEQKRQRVGLPQEEMRKSVRKWMNTQVTPRFAVQKDELFRQIMRSPMSAVEWLMREYSTYQKAIFNYCAGWRMCIFRQNTQDVEQLNAKRESARQAREEAAEKIELLRKSGELNRSMMIEAVKGIVPQIESVARRSVRVGSGKTGASQTSMAAKPAEPVPEKKQGTLKVAFMGPPQSGKTTAFNCFLKQEVFPIAALSHEHRALNRLRWRAFKSAELRYGGKHFAVPIEKLTEESLRLDRMNKGTDDKQRIVYWPCTFCKSDVEIMDFPPMESGTLTRDAFGRYVSEPDVVVYFMSALSPYTLADAAMVQELIGRPNVRRIIFVLSHIELLNGIDRVQSIPTTQFLQRTKDRITADLMQHIQTAFGADPAARLRASACIGRSITLIPLSGWNALKAYASHDDALLEKSGFPYVEQKVASTLSALR